MLWTLLAQATDPALIERVETIMWAQLVMAGVMVLCALAILAAALSVLLLVRRAMRGVEETRDQLLPHVTPVLSRASGIAEDVKEITAGLRRDADGVHETVDHLLDRTRGAVDDLDARVRRFGRVLEVVQQQAEELMMEAAATARGVHTAARALREEPTDAPRHATRRGRRG